MRALARRSGFAARGSRFARRGAGRTTSSTVDADEVAKFGARVDWADPASASGAGPLHALNPARAAYVRERVGGALAGLRVLDVGCGGGLLAEALAARGAAVDAVDASAASVAAAAARSAAAEKPFSTTVATPEALLDAGAGSYDVVCALEVLEHVADDAAFADALSALCRPGGHVFVSTLNRTPLAYGAAVVVAERWLGLLPRGTHDYEKFRTPDEVAALLGAAGCAVADARPVHYVPSPGGGGGRARGDRAETSTLQETGVRRPLQRWNARSSPRPERHRVRRWIGAGDARGAVNFVIHARKRAAPGE